MNEILDYQRQEQTYVEASTDKRLGNYILDSILISVFNHGVIDMINSLSEMGILSDGITITGISYRLLSYVLFFVYYFCCEYFLEGKTIAKYLTKTRAVTVDNQKMELETTILRTLCRFVPLERFSFLGNLPSGWHDRWSKSKVIEDNGWSA